MSIFVDLAVVYEAKFDYIYSYCMIIIAQLMQGRGTGGGCIQIGLGNAAAGTGRNHRSIQRSIPSLHSNPSFP